MRANERHKYIYRRGSTEECLEGWVIGPRDRQTPHGSPVQQLRLFHKGQEITCHYQQPQAVACGNAEAGYFRVYGTWERDKFTSCLYISSLEKITPPVDIAMARNLLRGTNMSLAIQLMELIGRLHLPIRRFLESVFADERLGNRFATLPGSLRHHHDFPGGLMVHSAECALMTAHFAYACFDRFEAELTIAAALLHDIGKTRQYKQDGKWSGVGNFVTHEQISLEVIAEQLRLFEEKWPLGANFIRHMLCWNEKHSRFPAFPGALLVRLCDRLSTAEHCRHKAFKDMPNHKYLAYGKDGDSSRYLRIPGDLLPKRGTKQLPRIMIEHRGLS